MRIQKIIIAFILCLGCTLPLRAQTETADYDIQTARSLVNTALSDTLGYHLLRQLTAMGHRLPGSENTKKAVSWAKQTMEGLGLENIILQPCPVPRWVRGPVESAYIMDIDGAAPCSLAVAALGRSIGTPARGITAPVLEVQSFDELKQKEDQAEGKIIFFNRPMDPGTIDTFSAYGRAVDQRVHGASKAAAAGGVAALVRSVTTKYDDVPHVGTMAYTDGIPKVPTAAVGLKSADLLSRRIRENPDLRVHLDLSCKNLAPVQSYNVFGQITGTEYPDEVIVIGGHFDCWDKGTGAHDDGACCIQALEALTLLQRLGIKPKRTIRVVFFMNEEMGLSGADVYGHWSGQNGELNMAGIEADRGAHVPRGFYVTAEPHVIETMQAWIPALNEACIEWIKKGGSGGDVARIKNAKAYIGFVPDVQRYFDFHHSANDVFSAVHPREMELGSAAMAILAYLISEHGI